VTELYGAEGTNKI